MEQEDIKCVACNPPYVDVCLPCKQKIHARVVESLNATGVLGRGYDITMFVDPLPKYLVCSVCHGALREPVQLVDCGHVFCEACIKTANSNGDLVEDEICPLDRETYEESFSDCSMKRIVLSMKVKCSFGCPWTGELWDLENHLKRECTESDHVVIKCINCDDEMEKKVLLTHLAGQCKSRLCKCEYCNERPLFTNLQKHISEDCQWHPVFCKYKCQTKTIPRSQLEEHYLSLCPLSQQKCPYSHLGCTFEGVKETLDSHLQQAVSVHLQEACTKINSQEKKLASLQTKYGELIAKSESRLNAKIKEFEAKIEYIKNHGTKTTSISNPGNKTIFIPSVFPLVNFAHKLQQAKDGDENVKVYSNAFYTHRHGYKYKIMVYLNGRAEHVGSAVAVFIVLVAGEYDTNLSWPFKLKVHLSVLSQDRDVDDLIREFTGNGDADAFKKPKDEGEGWGYKKMFEHSQIDKYVRNDILYLKCMFSE